MTPAPLNRRLPSVDLIAFFVGLVALALHTLWSPALGIVALAVFLPSVLRELGWLGDADEYTLSVMRRAGFHALLASVVIYLLNVLLLRFGLEAPFVAAGTDPFRGTAVRKLIVMAFLCSYLLQYWGARRGAFWLLIGAACVSAAQGLSLQFLKTQGDQQLFGALAGGVFAGMYLALALLVRSKPHWAGLSMLAGCAVLIGLVVWGLRDAPFIAGLLGVLLQALILFGFPGWALWKQR